MLKTIKRIVHPSQKEEIKKSPARAGQSEFSFKEITGNSNSSSGKSSKVVGKAQKPHVSHISEATKKIIEEIKNDA